MQIKHFEQMKSCLKIPIINQIRENETLIPKKFDKIFQIESKDETKNSLLGKNIIENVNLRKKIGRKKKKELKKEENKNIHSKKSKDNIIRKLRIHAIRFGLDLINDCIKKELKRQSHKLRMINRNITSNITIEMNKCFFNSTLEEIYQNSPNKTHKCDEDKNKKQIIKIRERKSEAIKTNQLLDMKFSDLYSLFIQDNKDFLIQNYGLNKAETLNDFLNTIQDNDDYKNELKNNGIHLMDFFQNTKSRKNKKKNL